jgi:nucleotide-binding universal stress UspA family protein
MEPRIHGILPAYGAILVPLDGSEVSEAALPLATTIAQTSHATLFVARVHAPATIGIDAVYLPPHWEAEVREDERAYLARIARRLAKQARVRIETELLDGTPGDAISRHAATVGADLIIASTHGRTGLARAWIGSTADWLVRFASVPVMLVRPREDEKPTGDRSFTHVLVPLDGSERSERIIPEARRIARASNARLTLLRVVMPITRSVFTQGRLAVSVIRDEQSTLQLMREAKDALEQLAGSLRHADSELRIETEVVADENTASAILARARDSAADLVAMCSRGRGASRLLVGSIADKLLRGFDGVLLMLGPVALRELESDSIVEEEEAGTGSR